LLKQPQPLAIFAVPIDQRRENPSVIAEGERSSGFDTVHAVRKA
jgi:hypothetical protein